MAGPMNALSRIASPVVGLLSGSTDVLLKMLGVRHANDPPVTEDEISAPLPVVRVDDLEAAFDAVTKAGGVIAKPIFSFPGGRRFHFIDPSGSELAVWQTAPES